MRRGDPAVVVRVSAEERAAYIAAAGAMGHGLSGWMRVMLNRAVGLPSARRRAGGARVAGTGAMRSTREGVGPVRRGRPVAAAVAAVVAKMAPAEEEW